jgi:LysR family transcriptional activator of nhaA
MECHEDRHERLLAELALYELDAVVTDMPVGPRAAFRAYNHLLGESGVSLFAASKLAERLRRSFPAALEETPFLLPIPQTSLRQALERWFDARGIRPRIRAELQDSALLMALGEAGEGVFPAPTVLATEIARQHGVVQVAELADVWERFYVITIERDIAHPAVRAITASAQSETFRR